MDAGEEERNACLYFIPDALLEMHINKLQGGVWCMAELCVSLCEAARYGDPLVGERRGCFPGPCGELVWPCCRAGPDREHGGR